MTDSRTGLELWQTMLGRLWIPGPGVDVINHLQWEQMVEKVYDHPLVHVHPGDVVIDCGAPIGAFTRVAQRAGAEIVVAIEPEQAHGDTDSHALMDREREKQQAFGAIDKPWRPG